LSAAGTAPLGFTEGGGSITSSKPICESFVTTSAEKPRPKMLSWFQSLMPRDEGFFDLFERHAQTVVAGSRALRSLLEGGEGILGYSQEIKRHENEADLITRDVLLAVRRTFITPFDRGDIRDLITAMDDTIDKMHQTAKATLIYETRDFEPPMRRMGDIIIQAADVTVAAIPLLRSMGQNAGKLNSLAGENADTALVDARRKLATLFKAPMGVESPSPISPYRFKRYQRIRVEAPRPLRDRTRILQLNRAPPIRTAFVRLACGNSRSGTARWRRPGRFGKRE
jgi:uncharacterized protein